MIVQDDQKVLLIAGSKVVKVTPSSLVEGDMIRVQNPDFTFGKVGPGVIGKVTGIPDLVDGKWSIPIQGE